ncbi:MAG: TolC family protein [Ruminiclostridium sp.]|nr:TolC family protein [Ruminiclostridium sp.]MBQ9932842.1 TolC family protein [Ruminiclostridium sp.]
MIKKTIAAGLACSLLLSVSAMAAPTQFSTAPQSVVDPAWKTITPSISTSTTLSYSLIDGKVRANNLAVKSMEASMKSMEAMDWDEIIDEIEDNIDRLEDQLAVLKAANQAGANAQAQIKQAAGETGGGTTTPTDPSDPTGMMGQIEEIVEGAIKESMAQMQAQQMAATLQSTIESLETQLEDIKEQKEDYKKTVADTKVQFASLINQTVAGIQSLYVSILSYEDQLTALKESQAAVQRMVDQMELRYQLGQISRLTLQQVRNSYDALLVGLDSMENGITFMKSSLQSQLGEEPTGQVTLTALPEVSAADISAASYSSDLDKAKAASYDLYSARRGVEDAKDDMDDARRENGKNSYQYKMAEHSHQAAQYQEQSAIQSFELSFLNLFNALAPAQTALETAQTTLDYEEQMYKVAELKYQLGNLSAHALADAKDTYENAKRDYKAAESDLFTAWTSYRNAVDYGLVTSGT